LLAQPCDSAASASINPNIHAQGYKFQPTHAVTADFPKGVDVPALLRALGDAGFKPEEIDVFQGAAALEQLDLHGDRHGAWVHFRRALESTFADEASAFNRVEEILKSGGVAVATSTGGDAARKARAAEVLKAHGGQDVRYWGTLTIERL